MQSRAGGRFAEEHVLLACSGAQVTPGLTGYICDVVVHEITRQLPGLLVFGAGNVLQCKEYLVLSQPQPTACAVEIAHLGDPRVDELILSEEVDIVIGRVIEI